MTVLPTGKGVHTAANPVSRESPTSIKVDGAASSSQILRPWCSPRRWGKPLNYSRFRSRKLLPAVAAAGLEHCGTHAFRHGNAALMAKAGVHPKTMQSRLGHEKISTTLQMYGHLLPSVDEEAAAAIGSVLGAGEGDATGTQIASTASA
jgi:integrase